MIPGLSALAILAVAMVTIWKACDFFDQGSTFVGRNMPPGVRGPTINAIGSSLPELFTASCLLFLFKDEDGFSAGIATCAGSAVFNIVIIPALCILAVVWKTKQALHITLDRPTIIRDGIFLIAAELMLITFLSDSVLTWWMGGTLVLAYGCYFWYLMAQNRQHREIKLAPTDLGYVVGVTTYRIERMKDDDSDDPDMTTAKAWSYLAASSVVIGIACYGLSWSVIELAHWWSVPTFLTAVVFGAAATSVPDTVLSLKDALRGDYDDAVANAVGSNIFDITVCLGLPLFIYGLIYGDVSMSSSGGAANVQVLRIGLIVISLTVIAMFLKFTRLRARHGVALLVLFGGWLAFLSTTA